MKTLLILISLLFAVAATSCASHKVADSAIDLESGYTYKELRECAVIVESNQSDCDPDGDIQNGDIDAAI